MNKTNQSVFHIHVDKISTCIPYVQTQTVSTKLCYYISDVMTESIIVSFFHIPSLKRKSYKLYHPKHFRLNHFMVGVRLRLAVPLYGRHLRKWRTESRDCMRAKQAKKSERKCRGTPRILRMHICVQSAHNDSDWSVSKSTIITPRRVPRLIAQRTMPRCVNPDALERSRA